MDPNHVPRGQAGGTRWDRVLLALTALACVVSIIAVLDHTKYPDPVRRVSAFQYLLRDQDLAGSVLIIAIAIAAYLPRSRGAALEVVEWLSRNTWPVAAAVFVGLCAAMFAVVHIHPVGGDEDLALFQSRAFAAGHLTGKFPLDLFYRLTPDGYQWRWLIASPDGAVAAAYWPGFSLLLLPFTLIGMPWACNPLLAALSLVLMAKLASRLTGNAQAGGWAMLFALASPGFSGMALSYFSMTAHLFLNLVFAWLILEGTRRCLLGAGAVGSFALVQSNPVPHILFALPWIRWIATGREARRNVLALAAGYAPLVFLLGFGWWLFLRHLQEKLGAGSSDADVHGLANLLHHLSIQFWIVFELPGDSTLTNRLLEQVRLWSWATPGLPLLALAGWWMGRRIAGVNLFAWSFARTLLGYFFVSFDQGYGWGARYAYSASGALPILDAIAIH